MTTYKVSDLSAASPDMDENEMQALVDSIRQVGQQVPILVYHGEVIDGRKRLAACERLGIEPKVQELEDDADPATYATALNLIRTHYNHSQRAMFASRIATLPRGTNQFRRAPEGVDVEISTSTVSEAEAARLVAVHRDYVAKAKRLRRGAAPVVVDAVERGDLTLHKATQIAALPAEQQPTAVRQLLELPKPKRRTAAVIPTAPGELKRNTGVRSSPRRDPAAVCGQAFASVRTMASILEEWGPLVVPTEEQVAEWQETSRAFAKAARAIFDHAIKEAS